MFEELPNMSPIDRPDIPPGSVPLVRPTWPVIVLLGVVLILVTGFFFGTCFLGPALESNPNHLIYSLEVMKSIGLHARGRAGGVMMLGLMSGIACIAVGIIQSRKG